MRTFVNAGQFNLMLGSRQGLALRSSDWSTKGRIKRDSLIIMSVHMRTEDVRRTACKSELNICKTGDWCCVYCRRFFRDCDTLRLLSQTAERTNLPTDQPRHRSSGLDPPSVDVFDEQTDRSGRDTEYDIGDLKNVDLWIVPRRRQSKVISMSYQGGLQVVKDVGNLQMFGGCGADDYLQQYLGQSGYVDGWISWDPLATSIVV